MQSDLTWFFKQVSKYPILERDEIRQLIEKAQKGDNKALNKLIMHNLRFVIARAKKYAKKAIRADLADLIQVGTLGLRKGILKFDLKHETELSTYIKWWIDCNLRRYLQNHGNIIRIPIYMQQLWNNISEKERELNLLGIECPENQKFGLLTRVGKKPKSTGEIKKEANLMSNGITHSLDAKVATKPEDADNVSYIDILEDESAEKPFERLYEFGGTTNEDVSIFLSQLMEKAKLSYKERIVIRRRFGIGQHEQESLKEIGKLLGLSRQRIQQMEKGAFKKLKKAYERYNKTP